jgi:murein DD-endopeptidase MepM/ murein hydrolase activator NlpD
MCVFCLPLRYLAVTSSFGYRIHPVTRKYSFHEGIDLRAHDDTVYAVLKGAVQQTGFQDLLGIYIRLDHGQFQTTYGHLSQLFVLAGDSVCAGCPIGITGATGRTTGEHLHFSVQFGHKYIDPLQFLINIQNNINQQNKEIIK